MDDYFGFVIATVIGLIVVGFAAAVYYDNEAQHFKCDLKYKNIEHAFSFQTGCLVNINGNWARVYMP